MAQVRVARAAAGGSQVAISGCNSVSIGHYRVGDGSRGDAGKRRGIDDVQPSPARRSSKGIGLQTVRVAAHGEGAAAMEAATRVREQQKLWNGQSAEITLATEQ